MTPRATCLTPGCGRPIYWSTAQRKWYHEDLDHPAEAPTPAEPAGRRRLVVVR